jgi:hypothetical protein
MAAARAAVIATAVVFLIAGLYTFYLSFAESPLRYETLPWAHQDAGHPPDTTKDDGNQFLIGVGKADITG